MTNLFPRPAVEARELRAYQTEAIDRLRDSLRSGHRRPLLQAPTGAGKTLVAATLVSLARAKQKRVVFVVPALSLIDQTLEAFWADGVGDIGVIQANHTETDWSRPVQIASVQTLTRRNVYPEADMVVIDEAHKVFDHYGRWMTDPAWRDKIPFIGLSATPWTKGLGNLYDDLIVLATTQQLIDQKYLTPFRVFAPTHPDLKGVRTQAGDYQQNDLAEAMNRQVLVADAVESWLRLAERRPTLCFAVDLAHARSLQAQFEARGVSCGYQDQNTTTSERREIKDRFHSGEFQVVVNCETLTVGVDWDVRCISMCRPTKSEILFTQIIGRGLRTADGKDYCLILDHSDNHARLGFVTDIHHDQLDDGKPRLKAEPRVVLPKECPECHYLRPPRVAVCPNCGHVPKERKAIAHGDGSLEEVTGTNKKKGTCKIKNKCVIMHQRHIPLHDFYAELQFYAINHGYKSGWAAHKYLSATGTWPDAYKNVPPMPISMEVASWIKGQQMRYAKGMEKRRDS